jgi:adenine-specific DNA-methyltransferase
LIYRFTEPEIYQFHFMEPLLLSIVEKSRLNISRTTEQSKKSLYGQFFTPASIACFMANMFTRTSVDNCRLLDAGAGIGSLSAAFLERYVSGDFLFKNIEIDAFEIDQSLLPYLVESLEIYKEIGNITLNIKDNDFIKTAASSLYGDLFNKSLPAYTHAILNPPYKKIRSNSEHRIALRKAGIETVNLYSAFVALSVALLEKGGQIVAIIPRSFCNGPYYLPFRKFLIEHAAFKHIHLFGSRTRAFKDDNVLQENVILMMERGTKQEEVLISTSTDSTFSDLKTFEYPFNDIVTPDDINHFIHIPTSQKKKILHLYPSVRYSPEDLGIGISTGPVVDFRMKSYLRTMPEKDTVPLLYPGHFDGYTIDWPKVNFKKPNAIVNNKDTEKWLYPNGFYCVVRRFSSKEEKRRVIAGVVRPDMFKEYKMLGFENHLNVFHEKKKGLPESLTYGLAGYLNSTSVDERFRLFNGHTQVNATDLMSLKYPSRNALITLGVWILEQGIPTQDEIDNKLRDMDQ